MVDLPSGVQILNPPEFHTLKQIRDRLGRRVFAQSLLKSQGCSCTLYVFLFDRLRDHLNDVNNVTLQGRALPELLVLTCTEASDLHV